MEEQKNPDPEKLRRCLEWSSGGLVFVAWPTDGNVERAFYWKEAGGEILTHQEYLQATSLLHQRGRGYVQMPCQTSDGETPDPCGFAKDVCPCRRPGYRWHGAK